MQALRKSSIRNFMSKPITYITILLLGIVLGIILVGSSPSGVKVAQANYTPYDEAIPAQEVDCLAKTIFFEARNESLAGQLAVALVVVNRTEGGKFPGTVCAVVKQGRYTGTTIAFEATPNSKSCQFTWYCDGITDSPEAVIAQSRTRQHLSNNVESREEIMWNQSQTIARVVLDRKVFDFTDQATHYHASRVTPHWAGHLARVGQIDRHTFYREK